MKKLTHIERKRREHARIKVQVQNLLNWSDMKYGQFQYEQGLAYLQSTRVSGGYGDRMAEELSHHQEYWSWWRIHWIKRDQYFMEMSTMLFSNELEEFYLDVHQLQSKSYRPHIKLMEKTYHAMIHKLVKEVVK